MSPPTSIAPTSKFIKTEPNRPLHLSEDHVVVVVSSSHQSPGLGALLFRSAQSITIQLLVWSGSKCSRKAGGCHEANDRSCGNGCALSGLFY